MGHIYTVGRGEHILIAALGDSHRYCHPVGLIILYTFK